MDLGQKFEPLWELANLGLLCLSFAVLFSILLFSITSLVAVGK